MVILSLLCLHVGTLAKAPKGYFFTYFAPQGFGGFPWIERPFLEVSTDWNFVKMILPLCLFHIGEMIWDMVTFHVDLTCPICTTFRAIGQFEFSYFCTLQDCWCAPRAVESCGRRLPHWVTWIPRRWWWLKCVGHPIDGWNFQLRLPNCYMIMYKVVDNWDRCVLVFMAEILYLDPRINHRGTTLGQGLMDSIWGET